MSAKIQEFQVNFMEIIDDISDDIPNDKYVMLCKDLKDNYNNFEDIQDKLKEYEESGVENMKREIEDMEEAMKDMERNVDKLVKDDILNKKFQKSVLGFLEHLNIKDVFMNTAVRRMLDIEVIEVDLKEVKSRIKNLKSNCCNGECEDDYESKYKELVNRIKNTSKSQLQKLKNEL